RFQISYFKIWRIRVQEGTPHQRLQVLASIRIRTCDLRHRLQDWKISLTNYHLQPSNFQLSLTKLNRHKPPVPQLLPVVPKLLPTKLRQHLRADFIEDRLAGGRVPLHRGCKARIDVGST